MIRVARVDLLAFAFLFLVIGIVIGCNWPRVPQIPCATEDSANCFWDASRHGNGLGQSFYDINGEVFYVSGNR